MFKDLYDSLQRGVLLDAIQFCKWQNDKFEGVIYKREKNFELCKSSELLKRNRGVWV